ncbi:MAG: S66 peptidase family protein [Phycisphaerales bacterium]
MTSGRQPLAYPHRLQAGSTCRLVSPASGMAGRPEIRHRLVRAIRFLRSLGLQVRLGRHALTTTGNTAGTAQVRADDLNASFADPRTDIIVSMIGGNFVCHEILPYLDYAAMHRTPKILMGYSDITALLLAIHRRTGLVVFYGPAVLPTFGDYPTVLSYTTEHFVRATFDPRPLGPLNPAPTWTDEFLDWFTQADSRRPRRLVPNAGWQWLQPGRAHGRLIGGCIQVLADMVRRSVDEIPPMDGALLFWESAEKNVSEPHDATTVARDLATLRDAGILRQITGMIVGRPYGYSRQMCVDLRRQLCDVLGRPEIPVLFGADLGHTDPMLTLPIGVQSTLDSDLDRWSIDEPAVL